MGIDLAAKQIVVVKSTQHFYSGFVPVAAPGAIPMEFADIGFEKFSNPYWPWVANPHD